ncbi:unnamed protein product [Blepharisma stoltei]|uniref:Uncharacterized protein n=1 Tax=Blepharisma stoltei TaxID=1481888 RepID=A0AAU9ICU9_9CILI|nr:unnamed protein product [Blepharisma stoltei]
MIIFQKWNFNSTAKFHYLSTLSLKNHKHYKRQLVYISLLYCINMKLEMIIYIVAINIWIVILANEVYCNEL